MGVQISPRAQLIFNGKNRSPLVGHKLVFLAFIFVVKLIFNGLLSINSPEKILIDVKSKI